MRVRSVNTFSPVPNRQQLMRPKKKRGKFAIILVALLTAGLMASHLPSGKVAAASSAIRSGVNGYCLDVHNNGTTPDTTVDNWHCNNTQAQAWTTTYDTIQHGSNMCLSVQGNRKTAGSPIVVSPCNQAPGQIWLHDQNGFKNPNSGLCLALPTAQRAEQVIVATCDLPSQVAEKWIPMSGSAVLPPPNCQQGIKGEKIACFAAQEWDTWQSNPTTHETLLNQYTDGTPYEAWCADFVSYVYKEAGYAFTQGETDEWDENNANNIQNMGFTPHNPSNYTPKPGDVAYFNYNGGHVEIVVSGGKTPTFIYGNSGTIDPTTDNGQMEANTITNDGSYGYLLYYLSPN